MKLSVVFNKFSFFRCSAGISRHTGQQQQIKIQNKLTNEPTKKATTWMDKTLSWAITQTVTFCHRTNRRVGGPLASSMDSTNTWPPKRLDLNWTPTVSVWRKNNCGRWNHRIPAKVSARVFYIIFFPQLFYIAKCT